MSYVTHLKYKPSFVQWIGDIPEHWETRRIKELSKLVTGMTPPTHDQDNYSEYQDFPWVRPEDLTVPASCTFATKFLSETGWNLSRVIKSESTLICCIGTIGKTGYVIQQVTTNQQITSAQFYQNPRFYFYALNATKSELELSAMGNVVRILNNERLGTIPLPKPPLDEADLIANFLDYKTAQIDALIAKKEALLTKLAEKRTAMISHAVTKGLDPSVPMKDSAVEWLGDIPKHWNTKRLKFSISIFGGGTPNTSNPEYWNGEIPWVSPKDMKCDLIESTEDYLTELGVRECATKVIPKDSVLIVVRSGILRHTIPVARNIVEVTLNQDMKALIVNNWLRSDFLHYFISGLQGGLLPLWIKQGCTVESIEMDYMRNSPIPLPPLDEQEAIVSYLIKSVEKIELQESKVGSAIKTLEEYRSALITNAVTGKIDVRDFTIPATDEAVVS